MTRIPKLIEVPPGEINHLEILPPGAGPVSQRLIESLRRCFCVRAAVCYFTGAPTDSPFMTQLAERLKHPESFLIADIHAPTDLQRLKWLAEQAPGKVRLFAIRFKQGRGTRGSLLHGKTWIFKNRDDKSAEIWIGSHNVTSSAMCGANFEVGIILKTPRTGKAYEAYKEQLKSLGSSFASDRNPTVAPWHSIPFEPEHLSLYEAVQNPPKGIQAIEAYDPTGRLSERDDQNRLLLLIQDPNDARSFNRLPKDDFRVLINSSGSREIKSYKATIQAEVKQGSTFIGLLNDTSDRLTWAVRDAERRIIKIHQREKIREDLLNSAALILDISLERQPTRRILACANPVWSEVEGISAWLNQQRENHQEFTGNSPQKLTMERLDIQQSSARRSASALTPVDPDAVNQPARIQIIERGD